MTRRNTYVCTERSAADQNAPLQNGKDSRYSPHVLLRAVRSSQGVFLLISVFSVLVAPVQPPHPLRGQQVDPPLIVSVVEQLHLSDLASLEGRQVAAPFMVISFENVAPLPTTAPLPHPVCHMTLHPSPSHDPEDPPTCSPNSPPGSPAGMQSCSSERLLFGPSAGVCRF